MSKPLELTVYVKAVDIPLPPKRPGAWVYFLLSGDDVVYVGQTRDINTRLAQHLSSDKSFDSARAISLGDVSNKVLDHVEAALIRACDPPLNKSRPTTMPGIQETVIDALGSGADVAAAIGTYLANYKLEMKR